MEQKPLHDRPGEPLGQRLEGEATNYVRVWAIAGGGTDGRATTELVAEENPFNLTEVLKVSQSVAASNFYVYRDGVEANVGANTFTFAIKPGPGVKSVGAETSSGQALYFRYDIDTEEISNRVDNSVEVTKLKNGFIQFSVTVSDYSSTVELLSVLAEPRPGSEGTTDAYFFTTAWNYNHSDQFEGHIITNGSAVIRAADALDIDAIAGGVDRGSILVRCQLTEGAPVLSFDGTALVTAPDDDSHVYVISYDGTETLISIDGTDATTGAGITPSLPLNVFRDSSSAGNGYIEDLVFSPIKKTAAQVKAASAAGEL